MNKQSRVGKSDELIFPLFLSFVLSFLFISNTVMAGVSVWKNAVELHPFETKTVCGLCVYSTSLSSGTFSIEYSENLEKFIKEIHPNNFELSPIDCPAEAEARRACIDAKCANPDSISAKTVCIEFKGPFELSFFPEKQEIYGTIRSVEKVGSATLVLPVDFVVYYTPFNAWLIVIPVVIIVVVAAYLWSKKH